MRLVETTAYVLDARFSRSEALVGAAHAGPPETLVLYRFALDGKLIERGQWPDRGIGAAARCVEVRSVYSVSPGPGAPPAVAQVDGRMFEGVSCGPISPDGRRMTYWIWGKDATAASRPIEIDQWVMELATGERRLLKAGLHHCGGCDSVPGPKWAPGSRYLYFSDVIAGGGRFFLADAQTGTTRQLADHVPREPFDVPAWSPVADTLLRSNGSGGTVLERVAAGETTVLRDIGWPARFDPSGTHIYSPAWQAETSPTRSTTVLHVSSGAIVSVAGRAGPRMYTGVGGPPTEPHAVVGLRDRFASALQDVPGCAGVALYRNETLLTCINGGTRPVFSPDGTKVALARATNDLGTNRRCSACNIREILVIDTASGTPIGSASQRVRVLMSDARTIDPLAVVAYSWNGASTHLLVFGPAAQ